MFLNINPLEQFTIKVIIPIKIFGIDVSFTNFSLFLLLAMLLSIFLPYIGLYKAELIPGKLQTLTEYMFEFVGSTITQFAGYAGVQYFGLIFSLFTFILMANLIGILPGAFTTTSHIGLTFIMAAFIFIVINTIGVMKHGINFLKLFMPPDVPFYLLPFIFTLEFVTFLTRPVTLSIRLFANMTAGHIVLEIFTIFIVMLMSHFVWLAFIPFSLHVLLSGFELVIAFLQAYIFSVLACIYLHDALNLH